MILFIALLRRSLFVAIRIPPRYFRRYRLRSPHLPRLPQQALDVGLSVVLHEMFHVPLREVHKRDVLHWRNA